jgi:hypothetical protein
MTFRTFLLMLGIGGTFPLSAQEIKKQPAHIGFTYPISSNGKQAALYSNTFSMHALIGVSRCETGVAIAGLSLVIKDSAGGLQMAGISNHITHTATGVQLAGVVNTMGNSRGLAAAGVANKSADANVQLAGVTNIAKQVKGIQVAGVVNKAMDTRGQLAGVVNIAKEVRSIQAAGLINKATKVKGVQLAGLLNIADSSDYPIGLINLIKNGSRMISVSIDESAIALASFRSGGRVLYGIVGVGYNVKTEKSLFATELGIGAHLLRKGAFSLQVEAASVGMFDFKGGEYYKHSLRVLPSYAFDKRLSVWAGPSFGYIFTDIQEAADLVHHPAWQEVRSDGTHQLAFGITGGVQIKI